MYDSLFTVLQRKSGQTHKKVLLLLLLVIVILLGVFMRITTKGQVTIPEEIREKYGFLPYSEVDFVEEKGKVYLQTIKGKNKRRGQNIVAQLRKSASVKMSTDEILALTRGEK